MPITNEELNQRPMTTMLVPMFEPENPNRFAVLFRFPSGRNQVWTFEGPQTPVDDDFVRNALRTLLEGIIADLREGRSEPRVKRDKQAFRETNWESVTGALQKLIIDWARKRVAWAANKSGIVLQ